ncbi:MAG: transcription-repair coupling factor [Clostridia bacterium]|nr:transcription-repair coupling factor [Clostridia bacterium]
MITPQSLRLHEIKELGRLENLYENRRADKKLSAVSVVRMTEGCKIHIISQLNLRRIIVVSDSLAAKALTRKLRSWGLKVSYMPYRDDVLIPRVGFSVQYVRERMKTLSDIITGNTDAVVTCIDTLLQLFPKRELIEKYSLRITFDSRITPQEAAVKLALAGYTCQDIVQEEGDFAVRGDILDIYSADGNAYRINFFDDSIESIKQINPGNMLPVADMDSVFVPPLSDIILDEKGAEEAKAGLGEHLGNKHAMDAYEQIHEGAIDPSLVWTIPFSRSCCTSFLEFLNDGIPSELIFDEHKVVYEKLCILLKETESRTKTLLEAGEILEEHRKSYLTKDDFMLDIIPWNKMSFSSALCQNNIFIPLTLIEPKSVPVTKYYLDFRNLITDIRNFQVNKIKIIFACGSKEHAKNMINHLYESGIEAAFSENGDDPHSVICTPLNIETGVIYPHSGVCLIGTSECIGKNTQEVVKYQKAHFIAPKAGDYVVHKVHGVGICEGTTIIKTGEFEKEYIVLKYRDGDTLYVPSDQTDNLQKFVGDENPRINKLGGAEFEREKNKVKASVKKLAFDLVQLYAKRESEKGFVYSEDTIWQKEFEDSFEYDETPDQLSAIRDIKDDMEHGKLMDRLVVGDVGFGKTEVAFRAIFKTVFDGKQAVLLAPTTILARQHYENLIPRLEPFGIKCCLLTRLQTAAEKDEILRGLKDGSVHIVIATHMVLSKNVDFNDLGILVLDEEQRFGVGHKESLKNKYPLINVLTLSATPIPRTLNMSLTGLRDISMLETPPQGRLPVQTYVSEYSDALCVDAITREMARNGQVLILCNDIAELDPFAEKLRDLCPGTPRIVTAHGQMAPQNLESRIAAFYDKKYDVLIATTIIENGIDLPDANTLIVIDSNRFGLSQLYQLRGRVGRRGVLAHAYFTLDSKTRLTADAEKRLTTLLDNTEIGSGFKIALSDLSIRGAGNILGAEQSGHISKVGYEMYLEILNETIQEIKTGVSAKKKINIDMKIDAPAYIKSGYVSAKDKIRIYKRIAVISSSSERDELIKEMTEIYGPVDGALINLINISLLKNLASHFSVAKIVINGNGAGVTFEDADIFKDETLMTAVSDNSDSVVLTTTMPPALIFNVKNYKADEKIVKVLEFFRKIIEK